MKLTYKYYRNSLIKVAIFSVVIVWMLGEHLRGKGNPNDEPGALVLLAVLVVIGNIGLFIAMRRAKRREQAKALEPKVSDALDCAE